MAGYRVYVAEHITAHQLSSANWECVHFQPFAFGKQNMLGSFLGQLHSAFAMSKEDADHQLTTGISLKAQECNHLQLSGHIHSNKWLKISVLDFCQTSALLRLFNIPHFLPHTNGEGKDSHFAERRLPRCASSVRVQGKSLAPFLPRSGRVAVLICSRMLIWMQIKSLSDKHVAAQCMLSVIQHSKCTRVHL